MYTVVYAPIADGGLNVIGGGGRDLGLLDLRYVYCIVYTPITGGEGGGRDLGLLDLHYVYTPITGGGGLNVILEGLEVVGAAWDPASSSIVQLEDTNTINR